MTAALASLAKYTVPTAVPAYGNNPAAPNTTAPCGVLSPNSFNPSYAHQLPGPETQKRTHQRLFDLFRAARERLSELGRMGVRSGDRGGSILGYFASRVGEAGGARRRAGFELAAGDAVLGRGGARGGEAWERAVGAGVAA